MAKTVSKILVIDDDQVFSEYVQALLSDIGCESITVSSLQEAEDNLVKHDICMLLVDVVMPELDGFQLLSELKQRFKSVPPAVFLTCLDSETDILKGYELGAVDYICKPIVKSTFQAKIKSLLKLIADKHSLEKQLNRSTAVLSKLEQIIHSSQDALIEINQNLNVVFANPAAIKLLNIPPQSYTGVKLSQLFPKQCPSNKFWADFITKKGLKAFTGRQQVSFRDGEGREGQIVIQVLKPDSNQGHIFIQLVELSSKKAKDERINVKIDPVTGLTTHQDFTQRCELAINHHAKDKESLGLIIVNIAQFSHLNDKFGHEVGDEVLYIVGKRIQAALRQTDIVSRFGNDEFAVLVADIPTWGLSHLVAKLSEAFGKPIDLDDGVSIAVRVYLGIALFPECGQDFTMLYQSAKIALSKARGDLSRNYCFFNNEVDEVSRFCLNITSRFGDALAANEFFVHYQPQYDLKTGELLGAEALVRWHNQEFGEIPPAIFIPIAEQSDVILRIGEYVIEQSLKDMQPLYSKLPTDFKLAINLSPMQLMKEHVSDLILFLYQHLQKRRLPNEFIELEITEHCLLSNDNQVLQELEQLKKHFFSLSLDDFGTGYSSLNYVQQLPIDRLKLDMSFVRRIGEDKKSEEIIYLIINLAKTLGLKVVAEGVETKPQLNFLQQAGCQIGQGYMFAKPMSIDSFSKIVDAKFNPIVK